MLRELMTDEYNNSSLNTICDNLNSSDFLFDGYEDGFRKDTNGEK